MSAVAVVKYASKSFTLPNTSIRLRSIIDDPNADIRDMAKLLRPFKARKSSLIAFGRNLFAMA